jgi:hypothetical protein
MEANHRLPSLRHPSPGGEELAAGSMAVEVSPDPRLARVHALRFLSSPYLHLPPLPPVILT